MDIKYELTNKIKEFLENALLTEISIGCSDSKVIKIEKQDNIYYLKIAQKGILTIEYEKLIWLNGKLVVPEVIMYEIEDNIEYIITKSLEGEMLCSNYYLKDNNWKLGIPIIIESLKELYKIDISTCPYNVSSDYKLELVKNNIDNNLIDINNISSEVIEKFKTPENIYNYLKENKIEEELTFTHGDISLPNIFAHKNKFSGFIDIGECGIADKWFDLAILTKTLKRNYGEESIDILFKELGIEKDNKKINYYLLLMELYL